MKSTDIKNWNYELSYKEIVKLDDFLNILTKAIAHDGCILCGGVGRILHDGLCLGCSMNLDGDDRRASDYILEKAEVTIKVVLPDNYLEKISGL
jgi:hypothetical protein